MPCAALLFVRGSSAPAPPACSQLCGRSNHTPHSRSLRAAMPWLTHPRASTAGPLYVFINETHSLNHENDGAAGNVEGEGGWGRGSLALPAWPTTAAA